MKKTMDIKKNIDVSIILVNYFTASLCKDVIQSIYEKTSGLNYEIIIVDNSNDEYEFSKLEKIEQEVLLIKAESNLGFGQGNNLGANYAQGKYLLFLNTDTLLINNCIYELLTFLEHESLVDIVGPNIYNRNMLPNASYEYLEKNLKTETNIFYFLFKKINRNYYFNKTKKPLRIKGYISGACLMIRKNTFDQLNGFSKEIFMYAEETLLCFEAIKKINSLIYNVPSAKIIHFEGSSFNNNSIVKDVAFVKGNFTYFRLAFGEKKAYKFIKRSIKVLKFKIFISLFRKDKRKRFKTLLDAFLKVEHEHKTFNQDSKQSHF